MLFLCHSCHYYHFASDSGSFEAAAAGGSECTFKLCHRNCKLMVRRLCANIATVGASTSLSTSSSLGVGFCLVPGLVAEGNNDSMIRTNLVIVSNSDKKRICSTCGRRSSSCLASRHLPITRREAATPLQEVPDPSLSPASL